MKGVKHRTGRLHFGVDYATIGKKEGSDAFMKEIFSRRSIRRFTPEPVTEQEVEKLLRAAMNAPSACNEQPWEFVVIRDSRVMQEIRKLHIYFGPLDTADCAVVVCGDTEKEIAPGFWVQDCSAAMENLLLETEHLGLGAVWMGVYPLEARVAAVKEILGLPEKVIPLGIAAVGRPAARVEPADRYRPERIHRDQW